MAAGAETVRSMRSNRTRAPRPHRPQSPKTRSHTDSLQTGEPTYCCSRIQPYTRDARDSSIFATQGELDPLQKKLNS